MSRWQMIPSRSVTTALQQCLDAQKTDTHDMYLEPLPQGISMQSALRFQRTLRLSKVRNRTGRKRDIICTTRRDKSRTDNAPCEGSTYLADASRKILRAPLVSNSTHSSVLHWSHISSAHIVLSSYPTALPVSATVPRIRVTTACLSRVFWSIRSRVAGVACGPLRGRFCSDGFRNVRSPAMTQQTSHNQFADLMLSRRVLRIIRGLVSRCQSFRTRVRYCVDVTRTSTVRSVRGARCVFVCIAALRTPITHGHCPVSYAFLLPVVAREVDAHRAHVV